MTSARRYSSGGERGAAPLRDAPFAVFGVLEVAHDVRAQ